MTRTFNDKPGVREATPLLIGLVGPSGGGKTYSALRLATGIQRVTGGDIFGIDTESRRMLHYADDFTFRHLEFAAPFGSLDYLAAIEHCVKKGGRIIIVDSMSHEHEGPGGVLERHREDTVRLAKQWNCSEDKAQISAWGPCKEDRRRMINSILQLNANFIFCFRAKEKLKIVQGKPPRELGLMPIAGEEFVFEMVIKCLLMPSADGVPTWFSDYPGERQMMKLPKQFRDLFLEKDGKPLNRRLDEAIGQRMAQWANGSLEVEALADALANSYEDCTPEQYAELEQQRQKIWQKLPAGKLKQRVQTAAHAAGERVGSQQGGLAV